MKAVLHDYQDYCVNFVLSHESSALLLDMGLGKTLISLTAIKELSDRAHGKAVQTNEIIGVPEADNRPITVLNITYRGDNGPLKLSSTRDNMNQ